MKRLFLGFALLLTLLSVSPASAAASLKELFFYTPAIAGGLKVKTQINLTEATTEALTISLSSSNTDVATVPATATVAAGAKYVIFYVTTAVVDASTSVKISGTVGSATVSRTLDVYAPYVSGVSLPSRLIGGLTGKGTVRLPGPAPSGGFEVTLATTSDLITIPASVTVAAGKTSATFSIGSVIVDSVHPITVTASGGGRSATGKMSLDPVMVSSVSLRNLSVVGGTSTTGTVKLNAYANEDLVVTLSASSDLVTLPATVTVPAGAKSVSFTIRTSAPTVTTKVTITAADGNATKTAKLTLNPAA